MPWPEPVGNLRILADVLAIVVVDERMEERLAEHQSNRQQQETADGRYLIAVLVPRHPAAGTYHPTELALVRRHAGRSPEKLSGPDPEDRDSQAVDAYFVFGRCNRELILRALVGDGACPSWDKRDSTERRHAANH